MVKLSKQVQYIYNVFGYLKYKFDKWEKYHTTRNVRFETTYTTKKRRRIITYIDEIKEHKITVTISAKSEDVVNDFRLKIDQHTSPKLRRSIKKELQPIIKRFILRNSL